MFRFLYFSHIFSIRHEIAFQIYFSETKFNNLICVECPVSDDGMDRFACPTPDRMGRYHCIDDHVLCDGFVDCPMGEDENRDHCMFYKTVSKIIYFIFMSRIEYFSVHVWQSISLNITVNEETKIYLLKLFQNIIVFIIFFFLCAYVCLIGI